MVPGDPVRHIGCAGCGTGVVLRLADDQALVHYPTHTAWVDLRDLEAALNDSGGIHEQVRIGPDVVRLGDW